MESRQLIGHAVHRAPYVLPAKVIVMLTANVLVVLFVEQTTVNQQVWREAIGLVVQIVVKVFFKKILFHNVNYFKYYVKVFSYKFFL